MARYVTIGPRSSLLIVGPTQVGKTSSLVVPALLRWRDAVIVTSVKNDVVEATSKWRRSLGDVQILEPGRDGGLTWDPLEGVTTLRHATRVARDLTLEFERSWGYRILERARDKAGGESSDPCARARRVDL